MESKLESQLKKESDQDDSQDRIEPDKDETESTVEARQGNNKKETQPFAGEKVYRPHRQTKR